MKTAATSPQASMIEVHWQDVRDQVNQLNPTVCKIIDDINPGPELTLFKATYPFGSEILKDGPLQIPNAEGKIVPLNSPEISPKMREQLGYNLGSNPVSMLLKNTAELFMLSENITMPLYGLIYPGKIFGTWQVLNQGSSHTPTCSWSMTAGARSLFTLPKITDTAGFNRLRQTFQVDAEKPKKLLNHWSVFREIANHPAFGEQWATEILFFSKKWFDNIDDPAWKNLKLYLLESAWKGSEFYRNEFMWDMIFSMIQRRRSIKPDPYIADTVRHLLWMSAGAQPGLIPASNDDAGPIQKLQYVLNEVYRTDYAPVIMQPGFLGPASPDPVYYSFEYPTTMKFSPKSREKSSKITELYETHRLLEKYLSDIRENKYNVAGTPLFQAAQSVQYEFFHPDSQKYSAIQSHSEVPRGDSRFEGMDRFPVNSAFLAGCIRMRHQFKS